MADGGSVANDVDLDLSEAELRAVIRSRILEPLESMMIDFGELSISLGAGGNGPPYFMALREMFNELQMVRLAADELSHSKESMRQFVECADSARRSRASEGVAR